MFDLLTIGDHWLGLPQDRWEAEEDFRKMAAIAAKLAVVNDAAECGVKDVQDYANSARDGAYRECIVLVSNSHRIKLPTFLKNEMEEHM